MARLIDYFAVVGYTIDETTNEPRGSVLQRFPKKDWEDHPFFDDIGLVCQPQGWRIERDYQEPKFFTSVLTDLKGGRKYFGCLTFHEERSNTFEVASDEADEAEGQENPNLTIKGNDSETKTHYAPKCLVLISNFNLPDAFRNCLGTIFSVNTNMINATLEVLIGNMIGSVAVPPPGGPQIRYSIGGGDRQAIQPPQNPMIPVTNTTVANLLAQIGIKNSLVLFCAVMNEQKLLFHSNSLMRLTEACHAISSLMYPFVFDHVYVPILPSKIIEVTDSPTPFIIGVHSTTKMDCNNLEVIVIDLDGGSITVPSDVSLPCLPDSTVAFATELLTSVLQPELKYADFAFHPLAIKPSNLVQLDKEIRAIFLRIIAEMFLGYRESLVIVRIHPKPFITFHKCKHIVKNLDLAQNQLLVKILGAMYFNKFVNERGCPWRPCDIWDELYCSLPEQLRLESQDHKKVMVHIQELASKMFLNENPHFQEYVPKSLKPTSQLGAPFFPLLEEEVVEKIMNEGLQKQSIERYQKSTTPNLSRNVPMGSLVHSGQNGPIANNSVLRLNVLRQCITNIFENKLSEAMKTLDAVTRFLDNKEAKLMLCRELNEHVEGNKAMLEPKQFDFVVKLMASALRGVHVLDGNGIAYALLPLAMAFCRKLNTGVIQFAYTSIQDNLVWKSQQFWETCFYSDVEQHIRALYVKQEKKSSSPYNHHDNQQKETKVVDQRTSLEIAAEQLRIASTIEPEKLEEMVGIEESTVYSQAIHYVTRMVSLLVPLHSYSGRFREFKHVDDDKGSNITSIAETDSLGAESMKIEEMDPMAESISTTIKFISRFVDKVCNESGVTSEHIASLHLMIPGMVHMQIETLEAVYKESQRNPTIQRPKIPAPTLLCGEEFINGFDGQIRAFLLADYVDVNMPQLKYFPSEGILYLTNYRVIFKGVPLDDLQSERKIIRSFPITSITREKRMNMKHSDIANDIPQYGLHLRTTSFQQMKIIFDNSVGSDSIDMLRKTINKLRHPPHIFSYYAFAGQNSNMDPPPVPNTKRKSMTFKNMAKKTLLSTAKKAGIKTKASKRDKYVFDWGTHGGTLPTSPTKYLSSSNNTQNQAKFAPPKDGDDLSLSDDEMLNGKMTEKLNYEKSMERVLERNYVKDWKRLGLFTRTGTSNSTSNMALKVDSFRISFANLSYTISRTYPAAFIFPGCITEDSTFRIARMFKHHRLPVVTWKNPNNRTLLLRASSFLLRGYQLLRTSQHTQFIGHSSGNGMAPNDSAAQIDLEFFLNAIIRSSPPLTSNGVKDHDGILDSYTPHVTTQSRFGEMAKHKSSTFIRTVTDTLKDGKGIGKTYANWMGKSRQDKSNAKLPDGITSRKSSTQSHQTVMSSGDGDSPVESEIFELKKSLYIYDEKTHYKTVRHVQAKIEYLRAEYPSTLDCRDSFKKLLRACTPTKVQESNVKKNVESSGWYDHLKIILELALSAVEILDNGSSVMLCLEDGFDITCQISSIAQICLDPYYRTIEGFHCLLEKEWLAFGHRFAHNNTTTRFDGPGGYNSFTPTFIQFLDMVHQISKQFPKAFEFNGFYIKFMAYHSVSGRFRTFLTDSEFERVEYGFMAIDDKRGSLPRHYKGVESLSDDDGVYISRTLAGNNNVQYYGQSIFDYVEKRHGKTNIFNNLLFDKTSSQVLKPETDIVSFETWEFFIQEDLKVGSLYDLELIKEESSLDVSDEKLGEEDRPIVEKGIDGKETDAFSQAYSEIHKLQNENGLLPQNYKTLAGEADVYAKGDTNILETKPISQKPFRKSTMDIINRGKIMKINESSPLINGHSFEHHAFISILANCNVCSGHLLGKTGLRCTNCGEKCHEKCVEGTTQCVGKNGSMNNISDKSKPTAAQNSVENDAYPPGATSQNYYKFNDFNSHLAENSTHEGYLFKKGVILKGWKQRWFVLDTTKHQLRYYETMADSEPKGTIDLTDVMNVRAVNSSEVTRKSDLRSFFEIQTVNRVYTFYATQPHVANGWIEKIQACLT